MQVGLDTLVGRIVQVGVIGLGTLVGRVVQVRRVMQVGLGPLVG
jgi:hypothetical protein